MKCSHCQLKEAKVSIKLQGKFKEVCYECDKLFKNTGRAPVSITVASNSKPFIADRQFDTKEEKKGDR